MNKTLLGYILCCAVVFGVLGLVTALQKLFFKPGSDVPRKLIHALVAFTWLPMYFYLRGTVHFIIIPVIFTAMNYCAERFHLIKSMERQRDDGKHDWGTVYYALCMVILSTVTYFFPAMLPCYGIAVFALSFGDGAAALVGTAFGHRNIELLKGKSLAGTIACALATIGGIYLVCTIIGQPVALWYVAVLGAITALLELVSGKADNIVVSIGIFAVSYLLL